MILFEGGIDVVLWSVSRKQCDPTERWVDVANQNRRTAADKSLENRGVEPETRLKLNPIGLQKVPEIRTRNILEIVM